MLSKCWTVTLLYPNLSTVLSVSCVFLLNKYQQCRLCAVFTIWTKYPLLANASLLNLPHRPHRSPLIPVACRSEQRVGRLQPLQRGGGAGLASRNFKCSQLGAMAEQVTPPLRRPSGYR